MAKLLIASHDHMFLVHRIFVTNQVAFIHRLNALKRDQNQIKKQLVEIIFQTNTTRFHKLTLIVLLVAPMLFYGSLR